MVATIILDFGGDEFYGCCKKRGRTDSRPLLTFLSAALLEVLKKCVAAAHATMNEVAAAYDDCDLPTKNTELPIGHESNGVYCQLWLLGWIKANGRLSCFRLIKQLFGAAAANTNNRQSTGTVSLLHYERESGTSAC